MRGQLAPEIELEQSQIREQVLRHDFHGQAIEVVMFVMFAVVNRKRIALRTLIGPETCGRLERASSSAGVRRGSANAIWGFAHVKIMERQRIDETERKPRLRPG